MSVLQPVHTEDLALVASIISGDEASSDAFARKFSERFAYLARRAGVPVQDCQDVAQEAMVAALGQMKRGVFRGDGKLGSWLAQIVHGKVMDYWRERPGASVIPLDEPGEAHEFVEAIPSPMADSELIACVHEALKALPRQHRVILLLKRTEGFTLEEIGQLLEMSIGQVSGKLYAAEEMFRCGLHDGKRTSPRTPGRALLTSGTRPKRRRREQSASHHPREGVSRAGNQQVVDGILLWASQRIGKANGRSAFAGMRLLLARNATAGCGSENLGFGSQPAAHAHAC
ncbi:MAG: sigma-70 family RNA polymerase sigma factor [Acidobacteria bacterium]|nr:sigma-70 family RNA polymerase sigma factor [Acidobacteriota bacterium]